MYLVSLYYKKQKRQTKKLKKKTKKKRKYKNKNKNKNNTLAAYEEEKCLKNMDAFLGKPLSFQKFQEALSDGISCMKKQEYQVPKS
jgi:hypothetical protein